MTWSPREPLGQPLRCQAPMQALTDGQDSTIVESQEIVQLALPIPKEDLLPALSLVLGVVEPHHQDPVELGDLLLVQGALGDRDVRLRTAAPFQEVRPMLGLVWSARAAMSSAAVWPVAAKWSLFCMIWKNFTHSGAEGW